MLLKISKLLMLTHLNLSIVSNAAFKIAQTGEKIMITINVGDAKILFEIDLEVSSFNLFLEKSLHC